MTANAEGRDAIQRIFPKAVFEWRQGRFPWTGWLSFVLHLPSLAAHCGNTLPPDLVKLKPLQLASDNQLSFLMASAAKDQGVRAAWLTFDHNERPTLNFLHGEFKRNPNVVNLPTVRPFNRSNPSEAFLHDMVLRAEANVALYGGTMVPIEKIIAGADLVLAMWQDLSKSHGVGFLVVKGEQLAKECELIEIKADAFMATCYEHALAAKRDLV